MVLYYIFVYFLAPSLFAPQYAERSSSEDSLLASGGLFGSSKKGLFDADDNEVFFNPFYIGSYCKNNVSGTNNY